MKITKPIIPLRLLIPIGLLMVVMPNFIKDVFNVVFPDLVQGILVGAGLGLEITGFILMKRKGASPCKVTGPNVQS